MAIPAIATMMSNLGFFISIGKRAPKIFARFPPNPDPPEKLRPLVFDAFPLLLFDELLPGSSSTILIGIFSNFDALI